VDGLGQSRPRAGNSAAQGGGLAVGAVRCSSRRAKAAHLGGRVVEARPSGRVEERPGRRILAGMSGRGQELREGGRAAEVVAPTRRRRRPAAKGRNGGGGLVRARLRDGQRAVCGRGGDELGEIDPCGFGPRSGDAGGVFGRGRPGWVAKLDFSFSTQPG
jgi:hypothetical protein